MIQETERLNYVLMEGQDNRKILYSIEKLEQQLGTMGELLDEKENMIEELRG